MTLPTDKYIDEPMIEELAGYAHDAWAGWMQYLFQKGTQHKDGSFTIDAESVKRWRYQMNTFYADLPEKMKPSDRAEAEKILDVMGWNSPVNTDVVPLT